MNATNKWFWTPLHIAAAGGHTEVICSSVVSAARCFGAHVQVQQQQASKI